MLTFDLYGGLDGTVKEFPSLLFRTSGERVGIAATKTTVENVRYYINYTKDAMIQHSG